MSIIITIIVWGAVIGIALFFANIFFTVLFALFAGVFIVIGTAITAVLNWFKAD